MRIRIRELCFREYLRIMCKVEDHCLRQLLSSSSRKGLCFCPLTYLSVMSKQLTRCLDGRSLYSEVNISASIIMHPAEVLEGSVVSVDSFGYHNRSPLDKQSVLEVYNSVEVTKGKSVTVFTDGSVYDGAVGCAACSAVMVPLLDDHKRCDSKAVGKRVASLTCELECIIVGMELSDEYFKFSKNRKP